MENYFIKNLVISDGGKNLSGREILLQNVDHRFDAFDVLRPEKVDNLLWDLSLSFELISAMKTLSFI